MKKLFIVLAVLLSITSCSLFYSPRMSIPDWLLGTWTARDLPSTDYISVSGDRISGKIEGKSFTITNSSPINSEFIYDDSYSLHLAVDSGLYRISFSYISYSGQLYVSAAYKRAGNHEFVYEYFI